jgi:hypothetical protein
MSISLREYVFLNSVAASTATNWVPVDYRFDGQQQRSIMGTKVAGDEVYVELKTSANVQDPVTKAQTAVVVIATATVYGTAASGPFSCVLTGPFTDIRIRKVFATGAATVVGVI